jgi:protein tyrosine phosphatase (PTP) superfamily phosphohydrolase (DUF442 family)
MAKLKDQWENRFFRVSFSNIAIFIIVWLLTGFTLGTGILMGPVRWITNFTRHNSLSRDLENILVILNILILIVVSFLVAAWLSSIIIKSSRKFFKILTFGILIIITGFIVWLWTFRPDIMIQNQSNVDKLNNVKAYGFYFGSYPTTNDLQKLKDDGFTAVISLLHPAVVPFEPKLINDEKQATASVGIQFIQIPMLPWVSQNQDAVDKIKELIKNKQARYYVHCYLGKDRVSVVKKIIQDNNGVVVDAGEFKETRKLDDISVFERGDIVKLEDQVFFTPFPTDEEYFGYILNGTYKQVVSLLNPENPEDTLFINKEEKLMKDFKIAYQLLPVPSEPYDPIALMDIVKRVKTLPKPLVIHAFLTKSTPAQGFILCYKTGLPALPANLFKMAMSNGEVKTLCVNAVTGGVPNIDEIQNYLYAKGIRNIAFTGNPNNAAIKKLIKEAEKAGMTWKNYDLKSDLLIKDIKAGNTWFVCGSTIEEIQAALASLKPNQVEDDQE